MSTTSLPIKVSASDRLGLTLFFAIAAHALVILGVSFDMEDLMPKDIPLSLEITLVHSSDSEAPEKADFLAQANQRGGGNVDEKVRPSSPAFNPYPNDERGDAEQSTPMSAPPPQTTTPETRVMTATVESREKVEQPEQSPKPATPEAPTLGEMMMRSRAIARVSANIEQKQQIYAQRKNVKTITASTREAVDAAYLDAWRQKIERIGNLNYPDEAKRRRLSGHLTLSVELKPDGSVHQVEVLQSSGHKVLDDGAVRIVRLAAPYSEIPPEVLKDNDLLRIVRIWQFQNESFQQTRR